MFVENVDGPLMNSRYFHDFLIICLVYKKIILLKTEGSKHSNCSPITVLNFAEIILKTYLLYMFVTI